MRQQFIQGYRYFIFSEFFLIAYNISNCSLATDLKYLKIKFKALFLILILITSWFLFDFSRIVIINNERSITLNKFLNHNISFLNSKNGLAWDVGMIGYFSNGRILDVNGLVNGRSVAKMSKEERVAYFTENYPIDFIFANKDQINSIQKTIENSSWIVYETYNFPNFSSKDDTHYLLLNSATLDPRD